jgi:hypothetical protein
MRPRAHVLITECRGQLAGALIDCSSAEEAQEQLRRLGFSEAIAELAQSNFDTLLELETGVKPTIAILNEPDLAHFVWFSEASAEVEHQIVRAITSPIARRFFPLSGIWRQYADAIQTFVFGVQPATTAIRIKGAERFYAPYVAYLRAQNRAEQELAKRDIQVSFLARNRDKRLVDWHGLDGDGTKPVRWNFRLFSAEQRASKRPWPDGPNMPPGS